MFLNSVWRRWRLAVDPLLLTHSLGGATNGFGLTTLETRRLRAQIEVFKILNGYEKFNRNISSQLRKREGLEDMELHEQRSSVD